MLTFRNFTGIRPSRPREVIDIIKRYRKKPVIVEAVQWTGSNRQEINRFVGSVLLTAPTNSLIIKTLEGNHFAKVNDFIIKGIHGEFYPCKPDIFMKTYEEVDEQEVPDIQDSRYYDM